MRQETAVVETALRLTLFPLLQRVDPVLYHHICVQSGLRESGFALSWVTAWFASDVGNLTVASRLVDVFLVSHPTMPIYCVVALLVSQRTRLLSCDPSLRSVYANLKSLKLMASLTMSDNEKEYNQAMKQTEEIIASALRYIKRFPPLLLAQGSGIIDNHLAAIAMLSETGSPSWCTKGSCPTEWDVLKRAKAMRTGQVHVEVQRGSFLSDGETKVGRAFAAAAYQKPRQKMSMFRSVFPWVAFFALACLLSAFGMYWRSGATEMVVPHVADPSSTLPTGVSSEPFIMEELHFCYNHENARSKRSSVYPAEGSSSHAVILFPGVTTSVIVRYPLTETEIDFEQYILKPFHASCKMLFHRAAKLFLTATNRFKPQKYELIEWTIHVDSVEEEVAGHLGTSIEDTKEDIIQRDNIPGSLEHEQLLVDCNSTAIVVSQIVPKTPTLMEKLKSRIKERIAPNVKRGVRKGKVALKSLIQLAIKISSANVAPFSGESMMLHTFP